MKPGAECGSAPGGGRYCLDYAATGRTALIGDNESLHARRPRQVAIEYLSMILDCSLAQLWVSCDVILQSLPECVAFGIWQLP